MFLPPATIAAKMSVETGTSIMRRPARRRRQGRMKPKLPERSQVRNAPPLPALQPHVDSRPDFLPVSIVLRIVLFIASHCSCAGVFFVALSWPCIVIGGNFPL